MVLITIISSNESARDESSRRRLRNAAARQAKPRSGGAMREAQSQAVRRQGTLLFAASLEARGDMSSPNVAVIRKCRLLRVKRVVLKVWGACGAQKIFRKLYDNQQMWRTDLQLWRSVLYFRRSWVQKSKHIHNFCFSPNLRRRCENAPERAVGAVKHNFEAWNINNCLKFFIFFLTDGAFCHMIEI